MKYLHLAFSVLTCSAATMVPTLAIAGNDFFTDMTPGRMQVQGPGGRMSFSMGAGVLALEAREWVFTETGSADNLSLLIWQSLSPSITANLAARPGGGWTYDLDGQIAGFGDGYMEDFDWMEPYNLGFGPEDWSDRSQHPDTSLEWYLNGSFTVGNDVISTDNAKINFNAGLALTSASWTARGGSAIYSDSGFRDLEFDLPDGEPAISYRQLFPEAFVGIDASIGAGPWQLSGGAKAGVTMLASATDIHWLRDLRFEDKLDPALVLGANARVAYRIDNGLQIFLAGQLNNVFLGRGGTATYEHSSGAPGGGVADVAGAQLFSASLSAGLSGDF